jgi:hypothetical protein
LAIRESGEGQSSLTFALGVAVRIRDITMADIRAGKNWRLTPPDDGRWFDAPMEEWGPLIETDQFTSGAHVVYSGVSACRSGRVVAIVQIKTVGDIDYGGDYCEFVGGAWRQVGLVPNPNAETSEEFIANPLSSDPSFTSGDYREYHRRGFRSHVAKLQ